MKKTRNGRDRARPGTLVVLCMALAGLAAPPSPVDCVDTRIGGSYRGHTFPGASCPFALVQASPDTGLCDWDHCSGYVWEDPFVYGFTQTHLSGTGCPDLADVRLLPFTDDFADPDPCTWKLAKDVRTEQGRPGLYAVAFTNAGVTAELTATPRVRGRCRTRCVARRMRPGPRSAREARTTSPARRGQFRRSSARQPNDLADVDGRYRGGDAQVATASSGAYYTGLSLWDTFRAAHPLYTLAVPERVDGFVDSMLAHYRAMGFLPVIPYFGWESHCMIGNHAVPVIVDAYRKGFRAFDVELAFEAVTNSLTVAHVDPFGRPKIKEDWALYDRYGYYPFDRIKGESVSRTLECGFDDWCAAEFCRLLGRGDEARFRARAAFWKNVFDPSLGLMRGKHSNGTWRTPFDPFRLGHDHNTANDFTEGNAFQYTWHVLQDPEGLIAAMGGRASFVERLDALFAQPERTEGMGFVGDVTGLIGQYAHGNEPSHHVAYFYALAGRPDRTAEVVREVCDRFYGVGPGDLCGNDDCGQMSAWYVFAAMGFYPFNPCSGEYVLGAPQFPEVRLALPGGASFRVVAKNLSRANKYVKSVTLNGRPLAGPRLKHADVVSGGELVFEMTAHGRDKPVP